ncbi:hypothetical protein HYPSUDRAFT_724107 [Hypholoma sublateritium FD-334 SS-4]|uniref:Uncharacterized protein n=1 Tax=Hypholoma sublateritium (strain FD-334 SS-4) TaxID=945553 RepID=A0A0D2L400_HYPSF|nr:hypothetical protein HYPSUDRAFT_724107 [Hypholoma sublateritium FD-334 SS-4]
MISSHARPRSRTDAVIAPREAVAPALYTYQPIVNAVGTLNAKHRHCPTDALRSKAHPYPIRPHRETSQRRWAHKARRYERVGGASRSSVLCHWWLRLICSRWDAQWAFLFDPKMVGAARATRIGSLWWSLVTRCLRTNLPPDVGEILAST